MLLENIYKFIRKNADINNLDKTIIMNLRKIEKIIEDFSRIKIKYLEMESNIKRSLDDYYGIIRDAEYQMKERFNDVWDQIVDQENKLIVYSEKEQIVNKSNKKIQNIVDKILSKFDDNFKFVIGEDENINILHKKEIVCKIILYKLKIVVRFMNYDLTINNMSDDTKLLDAYIMNKKI